VLNSIKRYSFTLFRYYHKDIIIQRKWILSEEYRRMFIINLVFFFFIRLQTTVDAPRTIFRKEREQKQRQKSKMILFQVLRCLRRRLAGYEEHVRQNRTLIFRNAYIV